jgi:hypothetical protein
VGPGARTSLLMSTLVCLLLSILVYARLTGYDLGYSRLATGKLPQATLFFLYLNVVLLVAAGATWRGLASTNGSVLALATHVILATAVVSAVVVSIAYIRDGGLGELARFVRFEVAPVSGMIAPVVAIGGYVAARLWPDASAPGSVPRWAPAGVPLVFGLIALALGVYGWSSLRPGPEPMVEQVAVVACGLVGPAFVLDVMALGATGNIRVVYHVGGLALTAVAALL